MEIQNENKTRILETALGLFALKGYDACGVREITDACGITKPTLYYYFGNKSGILDAVIDVHGKMMADSVGKACAYSHDLVKQVTECIRTESLYAAHDTPFFRLYAASSFEGSETELYRSFSGFRRTIEQMYDDLFMKSAAEFGNMRGHEKLYSRTFRFLSESTALSVINNEINLDDDTLYRIVHSFIYGIAS